MKRRRKREFPWNSCQLQICVVGDSNNVPAGYGRRGSTSRVRARGGQSHALDIGALGEGRAELHDGNITVVGVCVVVGVDHDRPDSFAFTGCAVLHPVLATRYEGTLLTTYNSSRTNGKAASDLVDSAVSSCDNGGWVDECATAEVAAIVLNGDNVWEFAQRSCCSTNDLVAIFGELRLNGVLGGRNRCREADGGNREGSEDVFDLHIDVG